MNNSIFYIGSPCEVPFTPVNGDFVCTQDSTGVNCSLSCLEGYDFTEGSTDKYYCAYVMGDCASCTLLPWWDIDCETHDTRGWGFGSRHMTQAKPIKVFFWKFGSLQVISARKWIGIGPSDGWSQGFCH